MSEDIYTVPISQTIEKHRPQLVVEAASDGERAAFLEASLWVASQTRRVVRAAGRRLQTPGVSE